MLAKTVLYQKYNFKDRMDHRHKLDPFLREENMLKKLTSFLTVTLIK